MFIFRKKGNLLSRHRNQEDIVSGVVKALSSLIGWDWGQCGDAAFFVQAAFRDADNDLKMFKWVTLVLT